MGAAFVTMSGNFMRVSRGNSGVEVRGDSAHTIIDRALMDLVRGSKSATSALNNPDPTIGDQSILADEYGEGLTADVATSGTDPTGQLIKLTLTNSSKPLVDIAGAYGGQVLTFISNSTVPPAAAVANVKGVSCRIFHYDTFDRSGPSPTPLVNPEFYVVPEWTNGQNPFSAPGNLVGAKVLINGRAFAGTAIVDPTTEPFDAIDKSNTFLAAVDFANGGQIYPSFYHLLASGYGNRPTQLPPLPLPVPLVPDVFDIDNDGDGKTDSIWVDPGYPVQTDKSGRQYKALVAYMVLDLDGRYNLNVHGGGDDARGRLVADRPLLDPPAIVPQGQGYGPPDVSLGRLFPPPLGFPATPTNFNQEYFNILGDPASQYFGRFGDDRDNVGTPTGLYAPGRSQFQDVWSQYKLTGYPIPGIGNMFGSRMDVFAKYGWGFSNQVAFIDPVTLPIGPGGVLPVGGDLPFGMPQVDATPPADDLIDNPFETDFSSYPSSGPSENPLVAGGSNRPDHLFSLKELERVYRAFDMDSKFLANRLLSLAPSLDASLPGNDPTRRLKVATESWEVPVPPANSAAELGTIMQTLAPTQLAQVSSMLAPDIVQGLKMDINRVFGDGIDDDGNGTVDYLANGTGEANLITYPDGSMLNLDISRNGALADNPLLAREDFAKQMYVLAMLRLGDAGDFDADGTPIYSVSDPTMTLQPNDLQDRFALAQYCINVVDFRDPDAIMSPFEFDNNPFNGWICDGNLLTDEATDGIDNDGDALIDAGDPKELERSVVWGCERPELLITETMAAHDRRTEDTAEGGTLAGGDINHFDSRLVPVASAFVELYAPWVSGTDVTYPAELYNANQVDLGRATTNGSPVWRIQIVRDENYEHYDGLTKPVGDPLDSRAIDPDGGLVPVADAYRYLYFVPPTAAITTYFGGEAFYPTVGFNLQLPVGEHAVVGSAGNLPVVGGKYVSTFGRRLTAIEGDPVSFDFANTRSISLVPSPAIPTDPKVEAIDFDALGVRVNRNRPSALSDPNVISIPIENPRSFNVSDPRDGYFVDALGFPIPALPIDDGLQYSSTRDVPIDYERRLSDVEFQAIRDDRTTPTYRVIYLQRLANPLADWDPVLNPYRTVDSSSVNLTAYNGVTSTIDTSLTGPTQPIEDALDQKRDFAAMERGKFEKYPTPRDLNPALTPDDHRLLWPEERRLVRQLPGPLFPTGYDDIGYLFPTGRLTTDLAGLDQHYFSSTMFESLGTYSEAYFDAGLDNTKPFTWLTWNNRPYVSQYELMLVPSKSSSQLLKSFSAKAANNPYDLFGPGFGHLPNFFLDEWVDTGMPPLPSVKNKFHKLLDFVEVPSRYVGTERYFDSDPATPLPIFGLAPPFNNISRFRTPGKVNINTIFDSDLWKDVLRDFYAAEFDNKAMNVVPPLVDAYDWMDKTRRPGGPGTQFTQPFRDYSFTGGSNNGLLRKGPGTEPDAMLAYSAAYFGVSGQQAHNNSDRNPYFRYDAIQRMGNLVTTRSSVFAIWITVGYFEVDPATGDLMANAQELGADSGQITRHRGFFIFDRSIPVAFEKGVDHNIERGILVQSYIE